MMRVLILVAIGCWLQILVSAYDCTGDDDQRRLARYERLTRTQRRQYYRDDPEQGQCMSHEQAEQSLSAHGIGIRCHNFQRGFSRSHDGCDGECVSLNHVRNRAINNLVLLKLTSNCAMTVIGGMEIKDYSGVSRHDNGWRLNLKSGACLTWLVRRKFKSMGRDTWCSTSGDLYVLKPTHWDIDFNNGPNGC